MVVKLESSAKSGQHALLVNCHFDSVPQSPGASDDAVSCAIMLEILEVLVQGEQPLRHNLVFLFNGAEENMLPVSEEEEEFEAPNLSGIVRLGGHFS